jgi:tripartite-type tricarboxylate transporter receptor subunit TctC
MTMRAIHRLRFLWCLLALGASGLHVQAQDRLCPDGKRSYFGVCPEDGNQSRPLPSPTPAPRPVPPPAVPSRVVSSFVVPFAPGGPTDAMVRSVAQSLGPQSVVENKPGNAGVPALQAFVQSPREGAAYFALTAATLHALKLTRQTALMEQVEPVALLAIQAYVLLVPASAAHRSYADWMASARSKRITAGTAGEGTLSELCLQQVGQAQRLALDLVPYKGVAPLLMDLAEGRIDLACVPASGLSNEALRARLTPIAVTIQDNPSLFPGIPTLASLGIKGAMSGDWLALVQHPRADTGATSVVNAEMPRVLVRPELEARAKQLYFYLFDTAAVTPSAAKKFLSNELR